MKILELVKNLASEAWGLIQKYYPIYIDWLSNKLNSDNAFGTLAIVGGAAFLMLFVYIYSRNNLS